MRFFIQQDAFDGNGGEVSIGFQQVFLPDSKSIFFVGDQNSQYTHFSTGGDKRDKAGFCIR